MHSFLCLPAREALMCKMRLNCCLRSISLGMAGIVACVAFPVQADSVSVPTPQPGQTSKATVFWELTNATSLGNKNIQESIQLVERYLAGAANTDQPSGAKFRGAYTSSNDTLQMGFFAGPEDSGAGHVVITLPNMNCIITNTDDFHGNFFKQLRTLAFEPNLGNLSTQMTVDSDITYSWEKMGLTGLEVTSGTYSSLIEKTTTTLSRGGPAYVEVGAGAIPGAYTINLPVECESKHGFPPAMQSLSLLNATARVTVNVEARPRSCSVQPPRPVTFSHGLVIKSKVQLDTGETLIRSSCDVSLGSPDIGSSMYLTFDAGSYGLYNNDVKKLGTSLKGYYITGGTDGPGGINPVSACSNSNMQFDGLTHAEFKLKTLKADDPQREVDTALYFSLCRDTSQQLVTGELHSDAKVNVVVK